MNWTPVIKEVLTSVRGNTYKVYKVVDWENGDGAKPEINLYISPFVASKNIKYAWIFDPMVKPTKIIVNQLNLYDITIEHDYNKPILY